MVPGYIVALKKLLTRGGSSKGSTERERERERDREREREWE